MMDIMAIGVAAAREDERERTIVLRISWCVDDDSKAERRTRERASAHRIGQENLKVSTGGTHVPSW